MPSGGFIQFVTTSLMTSTGSLKATLVSSTSAKFVEMKLSVLRMSADERYEPFLLNLFHMGLL